MLAGGKAEVLRTANIYYLGKRGSRSRFAESLTMRHRMVWRKSSEVPTLWPRCTYRGRLLYEDEIRSVEGPRRAATDSASVEVPGSLRVQIRVQRKSEGGAAPKEP